MDIKELKRITDLYGYIVKPEKIDNRLVFHRIFCKENVQISLWANVWNIKSFNVYEKYTSTIHINYKDLKNFDYCKVKSLLLKDILKQVIKKNIIMI